MDRKTEWREIPGYPGYYASKDGRIKGRRGHVLRQEITRNGYQRIETYRGSNDDRQKIYTHRAILLAFVGEPEPGQEARHLDGDPTNNHIDNLAWGTPAENGQDRVLHGRNLPGEMNPSSKLTADQVSEIRELYAAGGYSYRQLADRYGICNQNVSLIVNGQTWAHLAQ